ncbi:hypothetical protein [Tellurirhabdus bombi]|uniref:hypothetical protein n=1 Tax=Tellurirhabdus bombi TaxID=2907205 RepID=UPI001F1A8D43|nr:hypothetical protein [Tellurirhabdus bombi]
MKNRYRLIQHPALIWPILLAPILLFAWWTVRYAVNMPYQDDFDAIMGPVAELSKGPGFWKSLHILYVQDDERRIIVARLIAYLIYLVNGIHDHRIQIFVGCLALPGLWLLFAKTIRRLGMAWWAVVPVSLILFQPRYYEAVLWSMLPTQHLSVYFLIFCTLYLVAKPQRWAFIAAIITGIIAIGTDSNGSFAWAIGILILLYQQRYRALIIWVVSILPFLGLYYYRLEIPAYRPKLTDNLIQLPGVVIQEFFAFLGMPADPGFKFSLKLRLLVTTVVGVPLFLGAAYWLLGLLSQYKIIRWPMALLIPAERVRRFPQPVLFLTGGALILLLTMLAYATARAGDGIEDIYISRYKLISSLTLLVLYGLVLAGVPQRLRRYVAGVFVGIGLLFFTSGYFQYFEHMVNFRRTLLVDAYSWQYTRTLPSSPIYLSFREAVDKFVLMALEAKTYRFPEGIYTGLAALAKQDTAARQSLIAQISPDSNYLTILDERFERGSGLDDGAYTVLHSDSLTYLFPTLQNRNGIRLFLTQGRYFAPGYESTPILLKSLRPGTYRVGTLVVREPQREVIYSNWKLRVSTKNVQLNQ